MKDEKSELDLEMIAYQQAAYFLKLLKNERQDNSESILDSNEPTLQNEIDSMIPNLIMAYYDGYENESAILKEIGSELLVYKDARDETKSSFTCAFPDFTEFINGWDRKVHYTKDELKESWKKYGESMKKYLDGNKNSIMHIIQQYEWIPNPEGVDPIAYMQELYRADGGDIEEWDEEISGQDDTPDENS